MLIDDYIAYQIKYEKKYGARTIILMQVGSFFEAYGIDNEIERINVDNLYYICDLMNIQISRKNKNNVRTSRSNPLMAGFPTLAIDKFIQILMNNKFTVVLIEQVTEPPEPERKITNIFSPGTQINFCPSEETSNLVSIYIETVKDLKNYRDIICVGLSVIDLPTGKSTVFETFSEKDDQLKAYDEIYRFIQSHNPREIIFNIKSCPMKKEKLVTYLEINNKTYHFIEEDIEKATFKLSYQRTFLEKVYQDKNKGLLTIHEFLDLENKIYGTISFIFLLQFAYEHNESVIQKLEKPEIWESNQYLILTSNSISQLNLVDNSNANNNINNKYNSLLGIVNNASTAIGKRYLKEQLLNPINDANKLLKRYSFTEELLKKNRELDRPEFYYKIIETNLNKIMDIERLHRRMNLKILQPADFSNLDLAYSNIIEMIDTNPLFNSNSILTQLLPEEEDLISFRNYIEEYRTLFNLDEIVKYHLNNITNSFFNPGQVEEIDELQIEIDNLKELLSKLAEKISFYIEKTNIVVKVENIEKEGYFLQTTRKRGETFKKAMTNIKWKPFNINVKGKKYEINPKELELKFLKDRTKITSNLINNTSFKLRAKLDKLSALTIEIYLNKLEEFSSKYSNSLNKIVRFVAELDFYKSNAKTSILYGYTKPCIVEGDKSFVDIEAMRHPIIERIQTDIEYVPNDICIGNGDLDGMLLYGCNAVGKSSLMKAIGLNIIMAQSGMFVACSKFTFKPFNYVFTRISDNDNIFKGQSSFAVEMSELRSILNRSDKNSIVLGDELCSGTESVSAQSIFAASVIKLAKKNINFVFATHLHELYKMNDIRELDNVKSYHLKVIFEEETKKLIYDRKLEEGNGPTIYGLEVCKAMDLDPEFLKLANKIRKEILEIDERILETKTSNYNSDLFIHDCEICGEKAVDTHHIKEQQHFDENKMLGHLPKDNLSNLVPLCEKCHNSVHHGNLIIKGYKETSEGKELEYSEEENVSLKKSKKKYDEAQIKIIMRFRDIPNITMARACRLLEKNENIKISSQTLKKVWNGDY